MCGIAGIIRFDNQKVDESSLLQMRDAMQYRGPDDSGLFINNERSVALGHRRLSIIDLSPLGHQPMCNGDRDICISYNGEIYNFPDIKKELQYLGHIFQSSSDTEVILKAYQEWGEDSFRKLNGMFAFCVYDKRRDLLYLVRDHAGIKPLYYSISNSRLLFASEVKAFSALDNSWEENSDWKIYFLTFGHMPGPFTTLKDVYALPKGNFLRLHVGSGKYEIRRFIEMDFTERIVNEKDAIEQVRGVFTRAVKRHLISDVPVGVFLSGGIDSSIIALTAHRFQKENLRTLSVVFKEKEFSEEVYQDRLSRRINATHHTCLVTENDFIDNLDDIFRSMDQPTIDGINTYFIAKCAKEAGLKAVLSGLGGDELFGGYPSFTRVNHLWKVKKLHRNIRGLFNISEFSGSDKYRRLSFLSLPEPLSFYLLLRGLFTPRAVSEITGCSVADVYRALEKVDVKANEQLGKQNFVSYLETDFYMKNQLLKDTDFMSMRHSVEVRVPFLDRELMETVFSIKEDVKFKKGIPKSMLVKAFEDILPGEIAARKKQGFTFPFDVWLRNNAEGIVDGGLSRTNINRNYVEKLRRRFKQGMMHWSKVWVLVVMERLPMTIS